MKTNHTEFVIESLAHNIIYDITPSLAPWVTVPSRSLKDNLAVRNIELTGSSKPSTPQTPITISITALLNGALRSARSAMELRLSSASFSNRANCAGASWGCAACAVSRDKIDGCYVYTWSARVCLLASGSLRHRDCILSLRFCESRGVPFLTTFL